MNYLYDKIIEGLKLASFELAQYRQNVHEVDRAISLISDLLL